MKDVIWACPKCRIPLNKESNYKCSRCSFTMNIRKGYLDAGKPGDLRFSKGRRDHLAAIEETHFWFSPRNELIKRKFKKIIPTAQNIVELGCGTGKFLPVLGQLALSVFAVDAFEASIEVAAARQTNTLLVRGDVRAIPVEDETFVAAVSLDVLEHVEPAAFLAEAHRIVKRDGWLFLSVPAGPHLWSRMDEDAGHRCRYTREKLFEELGNAGWAIRGHTYYQCLLYPLMLVSRIFFNGRRYTERYPPKLLNILLGWINMTEVKLFSDMRLPWGSTLIVWAQKA